MGKELLPSGPFGRRDETRSPDALPDAGLQGEIASLLQGGRKLEAIKLYREQTGVGLKEANEAVEAIAVERRIVASGSGCLGRIVAIFLTGLAAIPTLVLKT